MYKLLTAGIVALPIIFVSCNNATSSSGNIIKAVPNRPDTSSPVITTAFNHSVFPVIFEASFEMGTTMTQDDVTTTFYRYDMGKIKIESGKIIAVDPIVMRDASAFTQVFPVGEFPVQLAVVKRGLHQRVAFSRIIFSDSAVVKWEFGLKKSQIPIPLGDSNFYCYGVDAGMGVFIDSVSCKIFNEKDFDDWEKVFITNTDRKDYKGYIHDFDGHNLATFSTGYGDGCYATYIGFSKDGTISRLLTDFGLVDWWKLKNR